jgi:hypothetical protein
MRRCDVADRLVSSVAVAESRLNKADEECEEKKSFDHETPGISPSMLLT